MLSQVSVSSLRLLPFFYLLLLIASCPSFISGYRFLQETPVAVYFLNLPALPSYALLYDQLKSKAHQESPARDSSPCPDGTFQSSSLLCYFKSADEHNGKPSNVLFGRGSDNSNACQATSHGRGLEILHTEQRPMGGIWKYTISTPYSGGVLEDTL